MMNYKKAFIPLHICYKETNVQGDERFFIRSDYIYSVLCTSKPTNIIH